MLSSTAIVRNGLSSVGLEINNSKCELLVINLTTSTERLHTSKVFYEKSPSISTQKNGRIGSSLHQESCPLHLRGKNKVLDNIIENPTSDNHSVSLANISVHYILQPIAGVLREAALFHRFIDDIIWIATSKLSNENIGQALTSAFANSGLELTFRQACTADQKGEVKLLDVNNHCITTNDDFGFVTEDFVKPTAEGRQFINRKSHHPQSTFKSILFGEAIRLRRLNQRKEDYFSSLNRLKEKAMSSNFSMDMTNDMIAMASNWEERLRVPKGEKKDDPQVWATSFPNLITLTKREKNLNPKAMITYKRPTTAQLDNYLLTTSTLL